METGLSPAALDLLTRAAQSAELMDEKGTGILPVQCWRTILLDLGLTEDSEGANFLMDFVEPCSQGHFTYKPLLAALSAQEPRRREDGPGKPPLGQLPSPEPSPGMGYEDVEDLLARAVRIVESMDEEGTGVLPVQCWRTILLELGLTEGSEGANFLMDFMEPCSQGHFTYKPLLVRRSEDGRKIGQGGSREVEALQEPSLRPEKDAFDFKLQLPTSLSPGVGSQDVEEQGQAASPSHGYPKEASCADSIHSAGTSRYVEKAPEPESSPLKEAQLREHEASHPPVRVLEVVDDVFWQKRGPAIQRLYGQWDCNQLTNQAFQAQMQQVLGNSVDITHPESEFLRLINKHLSARTMKFASMMSGLRRDAHSTARREGVSVAPSAWSAYEPSEAGTEASAAGRPTNPLAPMSRGGRRHFQLPSENYVLPGNKPAPALGGVPEDQVPQDLGAVARPKAQDMDIFGRKIAKPLPRRDLAKAETGSVASAASGMSEAEIQREAFSARNRSGHGNILAWDDGSRPLTPPKVREGRHVAVDPSGMPRLNMSSGIF
ncbi:unnamed protein product [Durusdinium trenchii]|uniref:Uncharacterized protein n=4 Tax=Durusdinium trenchii TaxID=1381693 RepID=A0ABP0S4F5_9DINO